MPSLSLKKEAATLSKQIDGWFRAEAGRHKPEQAQTTIHTAKRRRFVETSGHREKRKPFLDDDDDPELEIIPPTRKRRKYGQRVSVERVNMEDQDYIAFLGMLNANGDYYAKSGDYNLDFPRKNFVDNRTAFPRKNGVNNVGCGLKKSMEDDVDPDYKMFLANAREDGNSYVFELKKRKRTKVFIRYEEEEEKANVDNGKVVCDNSDNTSREENQQDFISKVKPKKEVLDNDFVETNGCSDQNPSPNLTNSHWFLSGCKPGTISCADESYLKFLDRLWVTGDSLTYAYEGVIVKYEDDKGVVTDSEELRPKVASRYCGKKFTPNPNPNTNILDTSEDDSDSVQILDDRSAKVDYEQMLRNKLREVLRKPFDGKELKEKLKAAKVRKLVEKTRNMRGRSVSYPTNRTSSSYLDLHPDLAGMLKGALEERVPGRALALLRCLFFYYENVSHEGSFVPWKNPPNWLHNIICGCPENSECPMNVPHGKTRHF